MDYCKYDLTPVVEDAAERFEQTREDSNGVNIRQYLQVFSWPQLWGSTSCGFGGISGAAMTTAQTIVVKCMGVNTVLVYHNNKFAYSVDKPNKEFHGCFNKKQLPGAALAEQVEALSN